MFQRYILNGLTEWSERPYRKPLILRGARQVGKTTAVSMLAEDFDQYIYLNLELKEDRQLFEQGYAVSELFEAICFVKNKDPQKNRTLLFIDEIQSSPEAVASLRYFFEELAHLYVIAAGSLLESLLGRHISFPVGRVEYLRMHPLTFEEFLGATGETQAVATLHRTPLPDFAHDKLLKLFHRYTLIGGMPEIVQRYAESKNLAQLKTIYESLITAYLDDVEKYADKDSKAEVIRHVIQSAFHEAGSRIKMAGFGQSNYGSKEISEAIAILEKALLLRRVYPTTSMQLPLIPNFKKSPKLQLLDTGLVNFFSGIQTEVFGSTDLNALYGGRIIEHLVGQELLASHDSMQFTPHFWVRKKAQSNAEVDFVLAHGNKIIPIEVKSGATGRLRSLHLFMDQVEHGYAVRLYAGKLSVEDVTTLEGKAYKLLNLPYFLAGRLEDYLEWFVK
ncbi:ATP-binding protein [Leucothrix pacifica]|uniref:AAA family ATPase n=1 Tax=Leucothrix pacifica TaxID=1247513 RepID=A0A317C9I5_9GAMM|nr:AAA family ATPase [Leucothrix pacifica]PWQ92722.1 AAA family ATPase [Leucothrix pacifica]